MSRLQVTVVLVSLAAVIIAPSLVYPILLMKVMCYALFALSFNLLIGQVGLLSFGHAAFFGFAGYVTGHVLKVWAMPTEVGLAAGAVAAGAMGLCVGYLAVRRHGIYFAMVTLAMSQLVYFFCLQAQFTGGEDGLQNIPRGTLLGFLSLGDDLTLYYVIAALFCGSIFAIDWIIRSPFGQVLNCIRDNETRAISLGYEVRRYKITVFVMSSAFAGLAGGMKALVFQLASLNDVSVHTSGDVVLMALIGGVGTLTGPILGAAFIVGMQNFLSSLGEFVTLVQGLLLITVVLALRGGLVGAIEFAYRRLIELVYRRLKRRDRLVPPEKAAPVK